MKIRTWLLAAALLAAAAAPAAAQDVPQLIEVIQTQPGNMDRVTWKEKRREAAKKLGASGDKRAVPILIELARSEVFDIIGEIAVDGLGQLGDPSAIDVLQEIANDETRDETQREKARKALAKLGSDVKRPDPDQPDGGTGTGGSGTGDGTGGGTGSGGGIGIGGGDSTPDEGEPKGPTWDDDVLAASEQLTFALGAASLAWDTVRQELAFDADVAGWYRRTLDRERSAYAFGGDARVIAGTTNPDGPETARLVIGQATVDGEFRAYTASGLYGIGFARARVEASRLSTIDDAGNRNSDRWFALDAQLALGAGYGRVLDVGTRLRVKRIATVLERNRALGRPIDDALARRLQSAWWALRGELGSHRMLTSTVAILRDAGVLLGEPDAGMTYELLEVLEDPALAGRMSGLDAHLAFGEGFLSRSRSPEDEDAGVDEGRLEELLLRARFGQQVGEVSDLEGSAYARYRLFPGDGEAAPWAVGVRGRWRTFVYGDHFDPRGALDIAAEVAAADDDLDETDLGARLGGELGWTIIISRASSIRVAGQAIFDSGEIFVGANLQAAYGLLDGAFAMTLD
jgi:hypothetical protein